MNSEVSPGMASGKHTVPETPPIGYRFHPNDDELVGYFLWFMLLGHDCQDMPIGVIDFYEREPWELPGLSKIKSNDRVWYFFCTRAVHKNKNKVSYRRKTKAGYWKPTGNPRKVGKGKIATKKTLVFYNNGSKGVKSEKTGWVMHEYEILNSYLPNSGDLVIIKLKIKLDEKTKKSQQNQLTSFASDFENQNQNEITTYNSREVTSSDFENQNQNGMMTYGRGEITPSDFENQNLVGMAYDIGKLSCSIPTTFGCEEQFATILGGRSHQTASASDFENQNEVTTTPCYSGCELTPFDYGYREITCHVVELSSPMTSDCEVQSANVLEGERSYPTTSASDFENQNEVMTNSSYSHHEMYHGMVNGLPSFPMAFGCEVQSAAVLEGEWSPRTSSASGYENQSEMTANSAGGGRESIPSDFGIPNKQNLKGIIAMSTDETGGPTYPTAFGCENQSSALENEEGELCFATTCPFNLENMTTHWKSIWDSSADDLWFSPDELLS